MSKGSFGVLSRFLVVGLLLGMGSMITARAYTPAGTEIRNQSVATYTDARGREQTSTSNEVITTVLPIYALEILPDSSGTDAPGVFAGDPALAQETAAGNTAYYSYTLHNQGNAADTFDLRYFLNELAPTSVRIYQDVNGNGQIDPGDRLLNDNVGAGTYGAVSTFPVAAGETINLLVAVQVPTNATTGAVIEVDIDARSTGDNDETDAVSNYSRTTVTDSGVLTASKAASQTSARGGDTITYTLTGSNTGNAPVYGQIVAGDVEIGNYGLLIKDVLDAGKYDLNTLAVVSSAPAAATVVYLDSDGDVWKGDVNDLDGELKGVGLFISTTDVGVPGGVALASGQSYSLEFSIDLAEGLTDGTVENTFQALYHDGTEDKEAESNTTLVRIAGPGAVVPGVALGPDGDPELGDDLDGQQEDGTSNEDYRVLAGNDADAGTVVRFVNTVRNTGNMTDTFNITVEDNTVVGGAATVSLFKSDGVTPLADTNGDGIPDTGPLAPGQNYNIVVRVRLPADAEDATKSHVQLRATTTNVDINGDRDTNDTYNVIGPIRPAGVDVGTTGSTGDGDPDDDTPAAQDVAPGGFVDFPLDIQNIRTDGTETGAADTYNLTIDGLPAGWTAVIYPDLDGDGNVDPDELSPITNTADLDPNEIENVVVRIFAPEDAVVDNIEDITFIATSTNNPAISDSVVLKVNVESTPGVTITPDNSGTGIRGGTVTYRHVVTNTGNTTEDMVLTGLSNWDFVFVDEDGVNLTETQTLEDMAPGESEEVFVKVFVPGNASVGATEILTVTVTGADSGATDDAVNATTVVDGNLQLTKQADESAVRPTLPDAVGSDEFHPITYTTVFQNLGSAPVEDVVIIDAIPANTRVVVVDNVPNGVDAPTDDTLNGATVEYSNDGGSTWAYAPTAAADHADSSVTHVRWEVGTVNAGASGSVTFQVLVD